MLTEPGPLSLHISWPCTAMPGKGSWGWRDFPRWRVGVTPFLLAHSPHADSCCLLLSSSELNLQIALSSFFGWSGQATYMILAKEASVIGRKHRTNPENSRANGCHSCYVLIVRHYMVMKSAMIASKLSSCWNLSKKDDLKCEWFSLCSMMGVTQESVVPRNTSSRTLGSCSGWQFIWKLNTQDTERSLCGHSPMVEVKGMQFSTVL